MLALWRELFPGDFSQTPSVPLSPDNMRDRIIQMPDLWTQLMRELYTDDLDPYSIWAPATTLMLAVRFSSQATWCTALNSGFVVALAQLIGSSYLCGYTQEQLLTAQDPRRVGRCTLMLDLFVACNGRILASEQKEDVTMILDVLQDTIVGIFVKLWDVRDPFLIALPENSAKGNDKSLSPVNHLYDLHATLDALGHDATKTLREHREIDFIGSHIPHVSLAIWLHSPAPEIREGALSTLGLLNDPRHPSRDLWTEFFCSADLGYSGDEQIARGLIRDLSDETIVDGSLTDVVILMVEWQNMYAGARDSLPLERRFAPYSMAAVRRQLCQGRSTETRGSIAMATTVFKNLGTGSLTSSKQCYNFLDLFCRYLRLHMDLYNDTPPPLLNTFIHWGLQQLHRLGKGVRPKSAAMRRHTLQESQVISDEIARRQLARRSDDWRRFVRTWQVVRTYLTPEPGEAQWTPFGALERCAWEECLCSRHKPAHRMRLCKGCELVVYCGARCQRSDWEEHRLRCRRVAR
ncbi:zinc finger MYND domain-containing protein [Phanerochaete sordida]|uniref:Zinc finger MYND domain-containing protein n=1 Tax=Phanerochaete sordida TaxID=48140 RepID=A0A9P3GEH6_9APHY|nr:zinc finger MYND domain-containing protein [Phanerochaete sordida]